MESERVREWERMKGCYYITYSQQKERVAHDRQGMALHTRWKESPFHKFLSIRSIYNIFSFLPSSPLQQNRKWGWENFFFFLSFFLFRLASDVVGVVQFYSSYTSFFLLFFSLLLLSFGFSSLVDAVGTCATVVWRKGCDIIALEWPRDEAFSTQSKTCSRRKKNFDWMKI